MLKTFEESLRLVRARSRRDWQRDFPEPALSLWIPKRPQEPLVPAESVGFADRTREDSGVGGPFLSIGRSHVGWLRKSDRNAFPVISLGRGDECDVRIDIATISKLHAVFASCAGVWSLSDRGARNGLVVNERAIESGGSTDLRSGDQLLFGTQVEATFHSSDGLYDFLSLLA